MEQSTVDKCEGCCELDGCGEFYVIDGANTVVSTNPALFISLSVWTTLNVIIYTLFSYKQNLVQFSGCFA